MSQGIRPLIFPVLGAVCFVLCGTSDSRAGFATFDDLDEGFYGTTLINGGITFFDVDDHGIPGSGTLAIDLVSGLYPSIPEFAPFFSTPNVLQMSAIDAGIGGTMARFGELKMTTGRVESFASLDVFHLDGELTIGNSIVLEAYLSDILVATDFVILPECCYQYDSLSITGVDFDVLRLVGTGPNQNGVFFGSIDNVAITPEPSALVFLGLSSFLVLRIRARRSIDWIQGSSDPRGRELPPLRGCRCRSRRFLRAGAG